MARKPIGRLAGEGGGLRLLVEDGAWPRDMMALFAFRMNNLPHIATVYGEEAARHARGVVCRILDKLVGDGGVVTPGAGTERGDVITVLVWKTDLLGATAPEACCTRFAEEFSSAIAELPVRFGDNRLHISVAGIWSLFGSARFGYESSASCRGVVAALSRARFDGLPVGPGEGWARQYRADMKMAAQLFEALSADQLTLAWQPVCHAMNDQAVLYHECLLRNDGAEDGAGPGEVVLALERLGLAGVLDRHVVSRVIEELACEPDVCLGVNISAQSACFDGWWRGVADRLRERPDIAPRLIVEITETTSFPDIGQAAAFAAQMRKLGVRIALDDFGVGHASIRHLLALQPDIVKVDRFFMYRARESGRGREALRHLVGLAGNMASTVIVEGVETRADDELASQVGAVWRQGFHKGSPSVIRAWRGGVSRQDADGAGRFMYPATVLREHFPCAGEGR
ncbi:MAG: EAL domain-containing protein [Sphingomonadales bacterium]|nr:MAG: EAL domain-containing protein [Sphingomonadales bacterium]TNF03161.1 MAG: EAL domain-containing protein [Sphingomonadales bacterium]